MRGLLCREKKRDLTSMTVPKKTSVIEHKNYSIEYFSPLRFILYPKTISVSKKNKDNDFGFD